MRSIRDGCACPRWLGRAGVGLQRRSGSFIACSLGGIIGLLAACAPLATGAAEYALSPAVMVAPPPAATAGLPIAPRIEETGPSQAPLPAPAAVVGDRQPTVAPRPAVSIHDSTITLPTYPLEPYQVDAIDPVYNWPYKQLDYERFQVEHPSPQPRTYRLIALENEHLRILLLPELGGRIWQVIHKPTGKPMFYQNTVVKPSPWGPAEQRGWLALGGLEWNLPVVEHGYDWGVPWQVTVQRGADWAGVTVSTPQDGRKLHAAVAISLRAGQASFSIAPTLTNVAAEPVAFAYWHTAQLAPGSGASPSGGLRFVLPTAAMQMHSTGDPSLPTTGQTLTWPTYADRNLSLLADWQHYLGLFEAPAAHGPFAGVYDPGYDAGAVRVFPAQVARGSKVFGLGWQTALGSELYTDDGSRYVELHGGLMPTFDQQYTLAPGEAVTWREVWYPVSGIGDLTFANEAAALHVLRQEGSIVVRLYPVQSLAGSIALVDGVRELARQSVHTQAGAPVEAVLTSGGAPLSGLSVQLRDADGRVVLNYPLD